MIKYIGSRPSTWNSGHLNTRRGKKSLGWFTLKTRAIFIARCSTSTDCTPQSWAGACYPSMAMWGGFPLLTIIDSIDPVKWGRYHFSRKWVSKTCNTNPGFYSPLGFWSRGGINLAENCHYLGETPLLITQRLLIRGWPCPNRGWWCIKQHRRLTLSPPLSVQAASHLPSCGWKGTHYLSHSNPQPAVQCDTRSTSTRYCLISLDPTMTQF